MGAFRTFIEQQEFVEFAQQSFQNPVKQKKWSASKDEILNMWKNLRVDTPIYLKPLPKVKGGSKTYNQDGIRITGSRHFIGSILARLKEILKHENPNTKLRLVFRAVDQQQQGDEPAYVFYVNSEMRGKGKAGRPKKKGLI